MMRDLLRLAAGATIGWHLTRRALARRRRARLLELLTARPTTAEILLAREAPLVARAAEKQAQYTAALDHAFAALIQEWDQPGAGVAWPARHWIGEDPRA